MSVYAPEGISDTEFSIKHGDEGINGRLQLTGTLHSDVTFAPPRGRCMQLTSAGSFKTGVHDNLPGMFLIDPYSQPTTSNPGTTASGRFQHQASSPSGKMTVCVGSRSYVVQSSAFDSTKMYVFGDPLTALADDTDADVGGLVTNAGTGSNNKVKKYVDPVIGVVVKTPVDNHNAVSTLWFLTTWLPSQAVN
jgi:hypothetical protein